MQNSQGSISGNFTGNTGSNNIYGSTVNNYGIQEPSYIPATFEELVARSGWRVSPPEIDLDHLRDEYNLPQADTGKWIFKDVEYKKWRESRESSLLWLCGGPGTGKTMLAKRVAAEFLKEDDDSLREVKLVFYFASPEPPIHRNSTDEDQLPHLSLAKVASDLLYSILQQDGDLFDGCKAELGKQGDRFFNNPGSLWKVLRKTIRDCCTNRVYILIDGIDGLGGRTHEELISKILGLMEIRNVKIFLSCRDVPYISNNLPHNPHICTKIDLDINHFVKADVEKFIRRKVNAWGWDADLKERALETLLARSEGIFLWASLAIGSLTYQCSGLDFDVFLEEPPSELEEIYRKMLSSLLKRKGWENVLDLVKHVALALRPLTFSELDYILACIEARGKAKQRPSHEGATGRNRPRTEGQIRMYVQSSLGFLRATSTTVSIVHHTAIEYLCDEKREDDLPILFTSNTDFIVSWECFQYLHHALGDPERLPDSDTIRCHDCPRDSSSVRGQQEEPPRGEPLWEVARKDPQEATAKHEFLRYAAESWFIHARRSIDISKDNFQNESTNNWLQYEFFETRDGIRKPWIELCGDSRMKVLAGEQTPLHIAICLGLTPLVEKALRDFPEGANSKGLLHLASRFISGVYKILIAKRNQSLLMDQDQDGNTPLHGAAISGHSSMFNYLVKQLRGDRECSNKINMTNHAGNTPLHLAFQFDHPEIVNLLVEAGADLTIKNNAQLTASELGARLEREESLDIIKQDEEERAEARREVQREPSYFRGNPNDLTTISSSNNTNIVNNSSLQPPPHCATIFKELIASTRWKASPPEIDLNHLCDEHNLPVADTGRWIFEDVGYKQWRESQESKVLWLCGAPGTGKTMLAKRVAAEFLNELGNPPSSAKLVFHFVTPKLPASLNPADENGLSQHILAKLASDLLYSILQQDGSLFDGCKAELERQGDTFFTNVSSLWEVLGNAIRGCRADPIYILIDGVDGLGENLCKELIARILKLMEIRTVKIFLSSRDVRHISSSLPHNPDEFTKINLDTNTAVKEDVEVFIRCRVNSWGWDVEPRDKAIKTLLAKSEGIFLWVSLAIDNLSHLGSGPDIDESLRKPLVELEDIYRKIQRTLFSGKVSRDVLSAIWCVALALRPLTFGELGYILVCIEEGTRAEKERSGPKRPGEIQPRTEKEIRMYVQSSMGFLRATDTTVSILHNSATEYLFNENRKDDLPILCKRVADLKIARECFRYLDNVFGDPGWLPGSEVLWYYGRYGSPGMRKDPQGEEEREPPWELARKCPQEAAVKWPYLRYAAESWFIHARRGFKISKVKYYDYPSEGWIFEQFFSHSDTIRKPWIELCGDPKMEILAENQGRVLVAACLGLAPLISKAIRAPRRLFRLRGFDFVSLKYCIPISQCIPSLLIDLDKNRNTSPKLDTKELRPTGSHFKYTEICNEKNPSGDTPLHLAFQFDHIDIVKLLLKEGADPTIKNNANLTPSELGAKLGRGYTLEKTRKGTVVVPVEGPGSKL